MDDFEPKVQYLVNVDVVDNVRIKDCGEYELDVEFTKGKDEHDVKFIEGKDEQDEFEDNSDDNSVKDIYFENSVDDRDDGDYFKSNVDSFVLELTFVTTQII